MPSRKRAILAGAALLAALALGVLLGTDQTSVLAAIAGPGDDRTILVSFRLPRVLLAAVAGAGLAVVGGAYQAMLRNPLADPYVLGVSGGAAVGATSVIAAGLGAATVLGAALIPLSALAGGLLSTVIVYEVARRAPGGPAGASILLAGVMVNFIASSLITFAKMLVPPTRAASMLRWLVGFIELPTYTSLAAVTVYVVLGSAVLLRDAGHLNLLALGDEAAETLGLDVKKLQRRTFAAASCVVGAVVALTGLIGFIGLVVPHAVRSLFGPDHRVLLPMSMVGGAGMLVLCDLLARVLFDVFGTQLPVGAVTALLGGPTFLFLLTRHREMAL